MTGRVVCLESADLFLQEPCVYSSRNGQMAAVSIAVLRNTSAAIAFTSNTSFPLYMVALTWR